MVDLQGVDLDPRKRKLVFPGDCLEMHPICQAMCCRHEWNVCLTPDEFASGRYKSETICILNIHPCPNTSRDCVNQFYRVAKREDNSCVYLEGNLCSIYDERPAVCREVHCRTGWQLDTIIRPEGGYPHLASPPETKEAFAERLRGDEIFIRHPLLKVLTVFYNKPRREINFVQEMIAGCGKFSTKDSFDYPQLDDGQIMAIVDLFNHQEPLDTIYQRHCAESPETLTRNEFFEIVWLLNKHKIVIDCRNLRGMLGSSGEWFNPHTLWGE